MRWILSNKEFNDLCKFTSIEGWGHQGYELNIELIRDKHIHNLVGNLSESNYLESH
jgi:hypothetical protein